MHDVVKKTIKFYEDAFKSFAQSRNKHPWPVLVKWAAKVKENDHILDLGCGNSRLYPLLKKHKRYLAVDPVKGFLDLAAKKYGVETFKAALPDIPESIGKFDKVFCIAVIQHLPKELHQKALKNIFNLMKEEGTLYLTCWNILYHKRLFNPFKKEYQIPYKAEGDIRYRYIYRFTPSYLKKILKKCGFKVLYCHYGEPDIKKSRYSGKNVIVKAVKDS